MWEPFNFQRKKWAFIPVSCLFKRREHEGKAGKDASW